MGVEVCKGRGEKGTKSVWEGGEAVLDSPEDSWESGLPEDAFQGAPCLWGCSSRPPYLPCPFMQLPFLYPSGSKSLPASLFWFTLWVTHPLAFVLPQGSQLKASANAPAV